MKQAMRDSSLHIAISGSESELDNEMKNKIEHTFKSLFDDSTRKISETKSSTVNEIIYELKTPVVHDEHMTKEFYENLEVLLYELIDFNPHFTQFRRVDN